MKPTSRPEKVLIALSGGIRSSVAAALLKSQGYEVIGLHLRLGSDSEPVHLELEGHCPLLHARERSQRARDLAQQLGLLLIEQDVQELYAAEVLDPMVHDALSLKRPNPCMGCIPNVLLRLLFQKVSEMNCTKVSTGHHAQVLHDAATSQDGIVRVYSGSEPDQDQSFYFSRMRQDELRKLLLPLGGLSTKMVLKLASELKVGIAAEEAQAGASSFYPPCFVGQAGYVRFIESRVAANLRHPGVIQTINGINIGGHQGFFRHQIGEKITTKIAGTSKAEVLTVVGFDRMTTSVIVGDEADLLQKRFLVADANWLRPMDQLRGIRCVAAKFGTIEHRKCAITLFENDRLELLFEEAQADVAVGDDLAFYEGSELLGGGKVEQAGY